MRSTSSCRIGAWLMLRTKRVVVEILRIVFVCVDWSDVGASRKSLACYNPGMLASFLGTLAA